MAKTFKINGQEYVPGQLVCLMQPAAEKRDPTTWKMANGPQCYVVAYSARYDQAELVAVDWSAAEALAPEQFALIRAEVERHRNRGIPRVHLVDDEAQLERLLKPQWS